MTAATAITTSSSTRVNPACLALVPIACFFITCSFLLFSLLSRRVTSASIQVGEDEQGIWRETKEFVVIRVSLRKPGTGFFLLAHVDPLCAATVRNPGFLFRPTSFRTGHPTSAGAQRRNPNEVTFLIADKPFLEAGKIVIRARTNKSPVVRPVRLPHTVLQSALRQSVKKAA